MTFSNVPLFQLPFTPINTRLSKSSSTCISRPKMILAANPSTDNESSGISSSTISSQSAPSSIPVPATLLEPVTLISGVDEYLNAVRESVDKLVVLKIFAPWCRSCRALEPKVKRLAREYTQVRFFEMDYEKNKDLCYRLNVASMPTFIFYYSKAGEIDKFSCGPMRIYVLKGKIDDVLRGECLLDDSSS